MRRLITTGLLLLLAAAPARGAGLLAPTDQTLPPLRVTDHLVEAAIDDGIARTTITQTFRNDTDRRLEATYVFPLPEHADLTDFRMSFNGKMAEGRVLPAAEALAIYESIVRQSKDPGLIEFVGRRLLQMRVFPIEPKSDTTVKLQYQQVCRPISGMTGFHYPLRTRRTSGQAHGTVRFDVRLASTAPLRNIWSPTHAVEIVRDGDHAARIAYEATGGSLEDDFLLLYGTDSSDLGLSVVCHRPDPAVPGHFVLMLTPTQLWPKGKVQPQDVVFVLDTSGSMAGRKLEQARAALSFCVDQLDEADRFSVVRFSTGFDVLFDVPTPATGEHRARAKEWIGSFSAAGGTNITDTLRHVVGMRADADGERPFVVIFLTDGQGNRPPDQVMEALAGVPGGLDDLRLFPFGVGHDVNTVLLDRLAADGRGRPTYVQPGENLELVLSDFFSIVSRPVLTDLRLTLPDLEATDRFPVTLGDLYHGQQIILAGRFAKQATGPVRLTATRSGERVEYDWPDVSFTSTAEADYVAAVWAGRKIAWMVDQIRRHGETSEMVAEIVALAQEHGLQTPYTSWLVDPERRGGMPVPVAARFGRGRGGATGGGGAPAAGPGPITVPGARLGEREAQRRMLDDLGVVAGDLPMLEIGDVDGDLAFAMDEASGEGAVRLARLNAELRGLSSRDHKRVDAGILARVKHDGRWYNRIGRYLVDEDVDEGTRITKVNFGSSAYFRLVREHRELRGALAAGRHVIVRLDGDEAVMVVDDGGIDEFPADDREQAEPADD
jgi:Ca-activated chloride channel family protein